MKADRLAYGSKDWLEAGFQGTEEDPWGLRWRASERERYDCVLRILRETRGSDSVSRSAGRALDIGCCTGHFSHQLLAEFAELVGIDISDTAVERGRRQYPDVRFQVGALPRLDFSEAQFDCVICLEMLYCLDRGAVPTALSCSRS